MYFLDQEHKERFIQELKKQEMGLGIDRNMQACIYIATSKKVENILYTENFSDKDSVVDFGFALTGKQKGECKIGSISKMTQLDKRVLIEALKIEGGFITISLDEDEIYTYEV